jgi:hypothetical protein
VVGLTSCACRDVPPFSKVDDTVIIRVDVVEEFVQARVWYGQAGAHKGSTQLGLVKVSIVITVDALK